MSLKSKGFSHDLVGSLKKDHDELSGLVASFTSTVTASDLEEGRRILCRIEDSAKNHFKFENDYLYPRMRRLLLGLLDNLCIEQMRLEEFIGRSHEVLKRRKRLTRNGSSAISELASAISGHLKDCDEVVSLAEKFSNEEKCELGQKLKEYRGRCSR